MLLLTKWLSRFGSLVIVGALVAACADAGTDDEPRGSTDSELKCISTNATKLAKVASAMEGRHSQHLCYRYVKQHLRGAGMSTADLEAKGYGASAYQFATWAKKYPDALAKMGLRKADVGLDQIPRGSVIVWPRGTCGYSSAHGHIEVVIDDSSSRACSDFCGRVKKGCGKPDVFVPNGCLSGPKPDEADDSDSSVKAPTTDDEAPDVGDGDGDAPVAKDAPADFGGGGGGCWSPTRDAQMDEGACVQSQSNSLFFQCSAGKWYRGVQGNVGPFGTCRGKFGLGASGSDSATETETETGTESDSETET